MTLLRDEIVLPMKRVLLNVTYQEFKVNFKDSNTIYCPNAPLKKLILKNEKCWTSLNFWPWNCFFLHFTFLGSIFSQRYIYSFEGSAWDSQFYISDLTHLQENICTSEKGFLKMFGRKSWIKEKTQFKHYNSFSKIFLEFLC